MQDTFHVGPTAASNLNGVNNLEITLPMARKVTIQAALFTTPAGILHWRVAYAASGAATALTSAEGFLMHGGTETLDLVPSRQAYLYVFLTDAAGTASAGGANDRVNKWITNA